MERKFDHTIVGKSYHSLLLGHKLLGEGRRVFLLDDDRVSLGEVYGRYLGDISVFFLKKWAANNALSPLQEIEHYLDPVNVEFSVSGRSILLGGAPSENLKEILRKMPDVFGGWSKAKSLNTLIETPETFDEEFNRYLAQRATEEGGEKGDFLEGVPEGIRLVFNSFTPIGSKAQTFLFSLRAFYQNTLGYRASGEMLFDLLLKMLSRYHRLKVHSFMDTLLAAFVSRGGGHKETRICDWAIDVANPWALELESFEGVLFPGEILFVGGLPEGMPLSWARGQDIFVGASMETSADSRFVSGISVFSNDHHLASTSPSLSFVFSVPGKKGRAIFPLKKRPGMKREFFRSPILKTWGRTLGDSGLSLEGESLGVAPDVWPGPGFQCQRDIIYTPNIKERVRLKNTHYLGPLTPGDCGSFSLLTACAGFPR